MLLTVVGLGNPGRQYQNNRHNAGFRVIDRLAHEYGVSLKKPFFKLYRISAFKVLHKQIILAKPLTYMNRSGTVIKDILKRTGSTPAELIVICDNLDLPPGNCRLKTKGSSGGQKGLGSIISALGTENFMRMYIGIGRPPDGVPVIEHVLSDPAGEELAAFTKSIHLAAEGIICILTQPVDKVMNLVNKRNDNTGNPANYQQSTDNS